MDYRQFEGIIRPRPEVPFILYDKTSKLKEENEEYSYNKGNKVRTMLDNGSDLLDDSGYRPYYLYRQTDGG